MLQLSTAESMVQGNGKPQSAFFGLFGTPKAPNRYLGTTHEGAFAEDVEELMENEEPGNVNEHEEHANTMESQSGSPVIVNGFIIIDSFSHKFYVYRVIIHCFLRLPNTIKVFPIFLLLAFLMIAEVIHLCQKQKQLTQKVELRRTPLWLLMIQWQEICLVFLVLVEVVLESHSSVETLVRHSLEPTKTNSLKQGLFTKVLTQTVQVFLVIT